ncbi:MULTISPECIES: DUF6979 family protein [Aeromonas]|jgi:hypothetical protein|nr:MULTISPECIES: hypothetical protein [Aeromonas]MCR3965957.1 hypothetical protein [Aeromonas veronii]MCR3978432.1 hypothetical protein [Aeromonas veronii]MDD1846373.1 hypothetical protein [Aeromonas veronii]UOR21084.1 hypothetical protein LOS88_10860 [Aeromonas veronii]BEE13716.1 hypothetical protein VAWG004_22190 [Aeromonas veronii]
MIVIDIYFSLSRLFGLTMGQTEGLVMIIYGKYGGAALRAVHLMVQNNYGHATAWDMAIAEAFGGDISTGKFKNNPKVTFLTLCSLGCISCIMPVHYVAATKTRAYVLAAIDLLSHKDITKPINPEQLWLEVISACKSGKVVKHNNQMDVILTLWYAGVLNPEWDRDAIRIDYRRI